MDIFTIEEKIKQAFPENEPIFIDSSLLSAGTEEDNLADMLYYIRDYSKLEGFHVDLMYTYAASMWLFLRYNVQILPEIFNEISEFYKIINEKASFLDRRLVSKKKRKKDFSIELAMQEKMHICLKDFMRVKSRFRKKIFSSKGYEDLVTIMRNNKSSDWETAKLFDELPKHITDLKVVCAGYYNSISKNIPTSIATEDRHLFNFYLFAYSLFSNLLQSPVKLIMPFRGVMLSSDAPDNIMAYSTGKEILPPSQFYLKVIASKFARYG